MQTMKKRIVFAGLSSIIINPGGRWLRAGCKEQAMKKALILVCGIMLCVSGARAESAQGTEARSPAAVLFISEQNIDGPRTGWWASEVDLSATETAIAGKLIDNGMRIIEPLELTQILEQKKAYRALDLSQSASIALGSLAHADYVIIGKAVASGAGTVPKSTMRSCHANITGKLVRVKGGRTIAYLSGTGSSAHVDVITGGREALVSAAASVASQVLEAMAKETQHVRR
jgi:hypothetical protein